MGDVVIPHFTLFGWQVFLVEAIAGVLLLLGWHTRIGAVIGLLQAIAITVLTVRAPAPVVLGVRALRRRQPARWPSSRRTGT